MSYLVLARKYRPASFDDIIGQEHVTRTLQNAIRKDKLHHAFLFTGTRGVGKTTTARVLAKALCCTSGDGPTETPCGECPSCLSIAQGNDIDVNEIDGASNNSVNDVRDLRDNAQYRPQKSRYKIYIIDEVHMLSGAAFNALLKTLEEPPEHVKFIFATTEGHKLPQTILSRCQRYDFKAVSTAALAEHIGKILGSENVSISETAKRMLARMARGSVRDGLSLVDSVLAYAGESVSEEDVRTVLGLADALMFERIVSALLDSNADEAFATVSDLVDYGHDLRQFGNEFLEYLRDAVLLSASPAAAKRLDRPDSEVKRLAQFAAKTDPARWIAWFDLMVEGQERIARSEQARYMLELTLAKMLQVGRLRSIDELLAGVSKLARKAAAGPDSSSSDGGANHNRAGAGRSESPVSPRSRLDTMSDSEEPPPIGDSEEPAMQVHNIPSNWEELVNRVKGDSKVLWGALRQAGIRSFDEREIHIELPKNSRPWDTVATVDGRRDVEASFERILGRHVRLKVSEGEAKESAPSIAENNRQQREARKQAAIKKGMEDRTVKMVREVFGGGEVKVIFHDTDS